MSTKELEEKVNEEYNNMYDPIGGVVIAMHPVYGPVFYQSIVKQVNYIYSPQFVDVTKEPESIEVFDDGSDEPPTFEPSTTSIPIVTQTALIKPECHLCGYYTKGQTNYYKCNTSDCPANTKKPKKSKK